MCVYRCMYPHVQIYVYHTHIKRQMSSRPAWSTDLHRETLSPKKHKKADEVSLGYCEDTVHLKSKLKAVRMEVLRDEE